MTEQRQLLMGHRGRLGTWQYTRQSNTALGRQLVQPTPARDRQELMVGGCADSASQACGHAEDGLSTGRKCSANHRWLQLPGLGIECQNSESALSDQLIDAAVDARVRQVDHGFSSQAPRLA